MKKLFLFSFLFVSLFSHGQDKSTPEAKTHKGFLLFDYFAVDMPANYLGADEDPIGLAGIHYNLDLKGGLYGGLGMYGAVRGERGGFFTLGANLGYKSYLYEGLFLDTGIHFGGGGGAGAPDGGGASLLPHINLGYKFKKYALSAGYSYINFFDEGNIESHQFTIGLQVPIYFNYTSIDEAGKVFRASNLKETDWEKKSKRISFMMHLYNLFARGSSQSIQGESLNGRTIHLAGLDVNSYFDDNWFAFARVDGAYDGIPAGYMNIFVGGGYHLGFDWHRTNILTKFGVGAGGGGGVDSQGGALIYSDISIEQHIADNIYLAISKGLLMSPDSFFKTSTFGVGLKYYTNINGVEDLQTTAKIRFQGLEVVVKQDVYLDANRIINLAENLSQIAMQLNYPLRKNVYLAGQTAFANFGNAGAYAEGTVGAGLQTSYVFDGRTNFFIQGLIGGAGGGDVATGEGLIIKPSAGLNYNLGNGLAFRGALGYVKSREGNLSSPMISLGLNYRFSFLSSR